MARCFGLRVICDLFFKPSIAADADNVLLLLCVFTTL